MRLDVNMQVASEAADKINEIGLWTAVAFKCKRPTVFGLEDLVGIAVFLRRDKEEIQADLSATMVAILASHVELPRNAVALVLIEGTMIDVITRDPSRLPEAQLIRRVVSDAASVRAPVFYDGPPMGPTGRRQPEAAWRSN